MNQTKQWMDFHAANCMWNINVNKKNKRNKNIFEGNIKTGTTDIW